MTPFFSIIIPLYNKEDYISRALESISYQSFSDYEIIIVNDGSTDQSLEIANAHKNCKTFIFSTENLGVSHARNFGAKQAKSAYLVFLDADDYWLPNHLADLKKLILTYPNCGLYCKAYKLEPSTHNFKRSITDEGVLDNFFEADKLNAIAHTSASCVPKEIFNAVGGFNENYQTGEDTDLWIKIGLKHKVAFGPSVSSVYVKNRHQSLTTKPLSSRRYFNFDTYKEFEKKNTSLKTYIDQNRLSLAFQHKLIGNKEKAEYYISEMLPANISTSQKILLGLPAGLLRFILKTRNQLRYLGIDLRLFR